jgi:hypothetical protein
VPMKISYLYITIRAETSDRRPSLATPFIINGEDATGQ